jgi:aspartyl-tRNA(Asn)/glutamyl-tRNA(Gln) amidotransferase subunit A
MRLRVPMRAALDALVARYDALLAPTRPRVAPPIGRDFDAPGPSAPGEPPPATIAAGNLAGLPAMALPNGFGQGSLPTSLQLLGRAFSEATLVAIAESYQAMTDWHTQRPPAPPA